MQKYPPLHIDINITIKTEDCCSEAPDTCNVLLQQYGLLAREHNNSERVFIVADHYQPINSSFISRKSIPRSGRDILWTRHFDVSLL